MRRISMPLAAVEVVALLAIVHTESVVAEESLFENVTRALSRSYYDESFRTAELPQLIDAYRGQAVASNTLHEEVDVIQMLLSNVPSTHLALLSKSAFARLFSELRGVDAPTFGFELMECDGKHYACNVLEGGPAARAGLLRGATE